MTVLARLHVAAEGNRDMPPIKVKNVGLLRSKSATSVARLWTPRASPAVTINFSGELLTGEEAYGTPLVAVAIRGRGNRRTNKQTDR